MTSNHGAIADSEAGHQSQETYTKKEVGKHAVWDNL